MLSFFYNGIKENGGKLQKASYSEGRLINFPTGTITIYKGGYDHFSSEIQAAFAVKNDSDMQSDYMETDRIRVEPSHPLYEQVKAASAKAIAHNEKRWAKRLAIHA